MKFWDTLMVIGFILELIWFLYLIIFGTRPKGPGMPKTQESPHTSGKSGIFRDRSLGTQVTNGISDQLSNP